MSSRRKKYAKWKKGNVPDYEKPARGTMPVRQYHEVDCSKICHMFAMDCQAIFRCVLLRNCKTVYIQFG
ncbi:hypothetical protein DPMN_164690 [Dreissena polymorpha]|uniref:Uncharacterized protein n=1 Tax=Dreissena polymorpha TaxID=45954 RepID=A0A9D4EWC2_DREPO|nr:hypothetical protein DPMN_164690 [Dreissena polymorpha]